MGVHRVSDAAAVHQAADAGSRLVSLHSNRDETLLTGAVVPPSHPRSPPVNPSRLAGDATPEAWAVSASDPLMRSAQAPGDGAASPGGAIRS